MQALGMYRFFTRPGDFGSRPGGVRGRACLVFLSQAFSGHLLFISSTIYPVVYYSFFLYILLLFIISILYTDYFTLVYMLFYTYYLPSYLYISLCSVLLYCVFYLYYCL